MLAPESPTREVVLEAEVMALQGLQSPRGSLALRIWVVGEEVLFLPLLQHPQVQAALVSSF